MKGSLKHILKKYLKYYKVRKRFAPEVKAEQLELVAYYKEQLEAGKLPKFEETGRRFVKYRFSAGTDFDLDKKNSFSIAYILDQQYNVSEPKRQHILSISYTRNLIKKD